MRQVFQNKKSTRNLFQQNIPGNELPENIMFSFGDKQVQTVLPRLLKNHVNNLQWLVETVECINSVHNPCISGQYRKLISLEFLKLHLI